MKNDIEHPNCELYEPGLKGQCKAKQIAPLMHTEVISIISLVGHTHSEPCWIITLTTTYVLLYLAFIWTMWVVSFQKTFAVTFDHEITVRKMGSSTAHNWGEIMQDGCFSSKVFMFSSGPHKTFVIVLSVWKKYRYITTRLKSKKNWFSAGSLQENRLIPFIQVIPTVFWNFQRILFVEYLEKG